MTPFWRGLKNIWSDPKNMGRSKKSQALGMTKGRAVLPWAVIAEQMMTKTLPFPLSSRAQPKVCGM